MSIVVPDAIEPVIGWKSWDINAGHLYSPTFPSVWWPEKALVASCVHVHYQFSWEPSSLSEEVAAQNNWELRRTLQPFNTYPPPRPEMILPPGLTWKLRVQKVSHPAPAEQCRCGIYIAHSAEEAAKYGSVMGRVYGWGKVVEHAKGWRVQYAYPAEIYARKERFSELAHYGIPLKDVLDLPKVIVPYYSEFQISPSRKTSYLSVYIAGVIGIIINGWLYWKEKGIFSLLAVAVIAAMLGVLTSLDLKRRGI